MLVAIGVFVWMQLGGGFSSSAPEIARPDIRPPDADEVGDKATEYGNKAADVVMGLSPNTWKIILIALAAGYLAWLIASRPKFKWAMIGAIIMLVIFIGVVPQL
jgi:hypothetical protein